MTAKRLLLLNLIGLVLLVLLAAGPSPQSGVGFRGWISCITVDPSSSCVYMLGREISLDANENTGITADTDDQIDFELGGADIFVMKEWGASSITSSTTEHLFEILDTTNVMTGGTNVLSALNIDLGIGNSTGGTNNIYGILIDSIAADAQNTQTAISIGSGWDAGFASAAPTDFTYVQGADSGATGDSVEIAFTSPVDTTGSNTHNALTVDLAIGNATGGTNIVRALQIDSITGDAEVTETAINVEAGWDVGLAVDAEADFTFVQAADAAAAANSVEIAFTSPVDTTGSNTHNAVTVDLAIGNATGGTNIVRALQIDSITGDAEVTETAINVEAGWDVGLAVAAEVDFTFVQAANAAAAANSVEIAFSSPVDTTGTNTHNGLTVDVSIGNATGGANAVTAIQIDAITDDPQVVETAIKIGDEWDIAIDTGLPIVATAVTWMDDFLGDTALGQYTEINGNDAQAVQAIAEVQYGAYVITSGDVGDTDANDLEATYLSLEWSADQGALIFETRLYLDTDITTTQLCAGFTDDVSTVEVAFTIGGSDVVTAVAEDAVMFCFDTRADTDEWFALGVANTVKATGNGATGIAPGAGVYQTLRIEVDDGGADCRFYIDSALVKTITANCITVADLLAPGFVISSADTADSNTVRVDYMFVAAARD